MASKPVVLISGFGPFGEHAVNASWEAVKLIPKEDIELKYGVRVVTVEIPVVYNHVDEHVPRLWNEYKPTLFIHVGVSGVADKFTLETVANTDGYGRLDCDGNLPLDKRNCSIKNNCLKFDCKLNVKGICEAFNSQFEDIKSCISVNAGRYLCEYIYCTSLSINASRTLFVHVPDIDKPYSVAQTARGLGAIVGLCMDQLDECESQCRG